MTHHPNGLPAESPPPDPDLEAGLAETEHLLAGSLAQLLRPPADLETRTQHRVASDLMSRSLLGTSADLLTVGWETLRFLIGRDEPTETADATTERTEEPT